MSAIKTAISMDGGLFKEMENLAKEWHVSRSELFAKAAREFIEKQKNLKILNKLNKIYAAGPVEQEKKFLKKALKYSSKVIDAW